MGFANTEVSLTASVTTILPTVALGTKLITGLLVTNVHPSVTVILDVWKEISGDRYYLESGKQLPSGSSRSAYALPLKGQAFLAGESMKAIVYAETPSWIEQTTPEEWAGIDWFGLFYSDTDVLAQANLTVYEL